MTMVVVLMPWVVSENSEFFFTILKDNIDILVRPLTIILNQSFKILKIAQASLIQEKEDTVPASNYSPISLLSVFSKIFEKPMYQRIYSFLCKYKLISTNQFGFCSNHSTEHALFTLIETITNL